MLNQYTDSLRCGTDLCKREGLTQRHRAEAPAKMLMRRDLNNYHLTFKGSLSGGKEPSLGPVRGAELKTLREMGGEPQEAKDIPLFAAQAFGDTTTLFQP